MYRSIAGKWIPVTREASKKSTFCSLPWNRKNCESPSARDSTNPYVAIPAWPGKSQQVFKKNLVR